MQEAAAAPVIVVGRVVAIDAGEPDPEASLLWSRKTLAMTAEVEVLRRYPESIDPSRIRIRYLAYAPGGPLQINTAPPPLSGLAPGQTLIFPLKANAHPAADPWRLIGDSGVHLTIPVLADLSDHRAVPSARAFLDREIVNTLSTGTTAGLASMARYLSGQDVDLTSELLPPLKAAIGEDPPRWARIAASLLAAQGEPRPSIAELRSAKLDEKISPSLRSRLLTQAVLLETQPTPDTDDLLIRAWIDAAPYDAWGSAGCLLEFGDNLTTTTLLRQALRDDVTGSSYIAWTLARNGHRATIDDALERALKLADRPDADPNDLQGAAALLRDFGNDAQLDRLAALVRKYQTTDREFYSRLWQYSTESGNPRETRVLAVVLCDRNMIFPPTAPDELRYCDFALGVLEKAVGQSFGAGAKTPQERDAAIAKALIWLESHGISDRIAH